MDAVFPQPEVAACIHVHVQQVCLVFQFLAVSAVGGFQQPFEQHGVNGCLVTGLEHVFYFHQMPVGHAEIQVTGVVHAVCAAPVVVRVHLISKVTFGGGYGACLDGLVVSVPCPCAGFAVFVAFHVFEIEFRQVVAVFTDVGIPEGFHGCFLIRLHVFLSEAEKEEAFPYLFYV